MKWNLYKQSAELKAGVLRAVVFGVPDKAPTSYTWQLHVMTGYFAAGSELTIEAAMASAERALIKSVDEINADMAANA